MDKERLYWLGFSAFPGIGPLRFKLLLDYFGSAKVAWEAGVEKLISTGLGEKTSRKFDEFRRTKPVNGIYQTLYKKNIKYLILTDSQFPKHLKEIPAPPFVLYVRGDISVLGEDRPKIGVVGTRKITSYGETVTRKITQGLVDAGFTIVSGMAYGVDGVAHRTAIENGGKTIAVLGCGVDVIHPASNTDLYNKIIAGAGVVVSEFPPGMLVTKGLFPSRNRIISGLSLGVVVTEGARDSGALITARNAAEQGREVFAVPGPITSELSEGPMRLIRDGAKMISDAGEILEELNIKFKAQSAKFKTKFENLNLKLTVDERKIIEELQNEDLHLDDIARKTAIPAGKLASLLTMMEMKGIVVNSGGNYGLKEA